MFLSFVIVYEIVVLFHTVAEHLLVALLLPAAGECHHVCCYCCFFTFADLIPVQSIDIVDMYYDLNMIKVPN